MIQKIQAQTQSQKPQVFCLDIDGSFSQNLPLSCQVDLSESIAWDFFRDCTNEFHFETVAQSLIPDGQSDKFWSQAARTVFVALCLRVKAENPEASLQDLYQLTCETPLAILKEKMRGTAAGSLVSGDHDDKFFASIVGTMSTYCSKLRYFLSGEGHAFSLENLFATHSDLLVQISQTRLAALKPILTVWFELIIERILSSESDLGWESKFVVILDELASLNQIPSLPMLASRGRKYGVTLLLGIQDIDQLKALYRDSAESLAANLSTKFFLRQGSQKNAIWAAEIIGSEQHQKQRRSTSFGSSDHRDSISLSEQEVKDFVVLPTELLTLNARAAIVRQLHFNPVNLIF